MAAKYDAIVVFSFDGKGDFEEVNLLREKYLKKGKKFHHVILTADPDSIRKKYPDLASDIVDTQTIQEADTSLLTCPIHEKTKVIIKGHGQANSGSIESAAGTKVTMSVLAKFLKRNCRDDAIQISFYVCHAGIGKVVGMVEGSIAQVLYDNLCEQGLKPTISAPTSIIVVSSVDGKKAVYPIIEDDSLILVQIERSIISEQIAAISRFPWTSARKELQTLYDIEKSFLYRRFYKGLDSKVIFNSDGTIFFPYAESEFITLSDEDETIKGLCAYYRARQGYGDSARVICLQYLADIAAKEPKIQNYKGFHSLKKIISTRPYPYPALLGLIAEKLKNETELMQFSAENGTWQENKKILDDNLGGQEERRALLSIALDDFKDQINTNLKLKEIQGVHTAFARDIKNRFSDKEADKKTATYSIIISGGLTLLCVSIALITEPMLSLIMLVTLCAAVGSVAVGVLGYGLVSDYRYLQAKQKQRVRCDDIVFSVSIDPPSESYFYSELQKESTCSSEHDSEVESTESLVVSSTVRTPVTADFMRYGLYSTSGVRINSVGDPIKNEYPKQERRVCGSAR